LPIYIYRTSTEIYPLRAVGIKFKGRRMSLSAGGKKHQAIRPAAVVSQEIRKEN